MKNIAVIGATGGIGAALLHWCSARWPLANLWASHRPQNPHPQPSSNVRWLPLDLAQDASITAFTESLTTVTAQLDLLLICTGWLHDEQHQPEKSLRELDSQMLEKALRINASAPLLLMAQLSPLLTRADGVTERAKIIVLSAKVGSIADNSLGGWHSYRMSKAALNMGVRNLGIEFGRSRRKPLIAAVHPGTTETQLSEPFAKRGLNVVPAAVAADRLGNFVVAMTDTHLGGLYHWDGTPIPW